jgi:predicted ester cyclase
MATPRERADAFGEAYNAHDLATIRRYLRSDVVLWAPDAGELKGPDQFLEYMKGFFEAFPDAELEPVAGYDAGNTTIDEWIFRGSNQGPLTLLRGETIPPTGKRIAVPGMDIETWDDEGLLIGDRAYFDKLDFLTQLGLVPAA